MNFRLTLIYIFIGIITITLLSRVYFYLSNQTLTMKSYQKTII